MQAEHGGALVDRAAECRKASSVRVCIWLIPLQPLLCVALCGIDIDPATVIQWFT
nr:MAG TPA: hypothetical protein [Caudoviricetes sp.]